MRGRGGGERGFGGLRESSLHRLHKSRHRRNSRAPPATHELATVSPASRSSTSSSSSGASMYNSFLCKRSQRCVYDSAQKTVFSNWTPREMMELAVVRMELYTCAIGSVSRCPNQLAANFRLLKPPGSE